MIQAPGKNNIISQIQQRTSEKRLQPEHIWGWMAESTQEFFLHPSYRMFEYSLIQAMREAYPEPIEKVGEHVLLAQIKFARIFTNNQLKRLAKALQHNLELWRQGTPMIGLDDEFNAIVLISDRSA